MEDEKYSHERVERARGPSHNCAEQRSTHRAKQSTPCHCREFILFLLFNRHVFLN